MGIKNYTYKERMILNTELASYLQPYYENNGYKLAKLVDEVLAKLNFHGVHKEDFVSLADEIIFNAMYDFDFEQEFHGYIYRCLENKFKTEMTRLNRYKRKADKMSISLDTPIGDGEDSTLEDIISDNRTIEREIFEEEEVYSEKMYKYLSRLSDLQKEVLRLISIGFTPGEIIEELHINHKIYEDCYNAIHSYRNTSILL